MKEGIKTAHRGKVKGKPAHYVKRDKRGRFKKWTGVGRSIRADRRKKVGHKRIPKTRTKRLRTGYGHKGDYPRKRRRKSKILGGLVR